MKKINALESLILEKNSETKKKEPQVDLLFVQSTDKNLLTPVGGAIVAGFDKNLVQLVAKTYPGRASASPTVDALITLLEMGREGWGRLMESRERLYSLFATELQALCERLGCLRLMHTQDNPISFAVNLAGLLDKDSERCTDGDNTSIAKLTQIGAHLFTQGCSGVRVVLPASLQSKVTVIDDFEFRGFGAHSDEDFVEPYLNVAASVGQREEEIHFFIRHLEEAVKKFFPNKIAIQ